MFSVVRLALIITSALLYRLVILRGKIPFLMIGKRRRVTLFVLVAVNIIFCMVPIENVLLRFPSPEQAFRYAYPYDIVEGMVKNDDHAIILHHNMRDDQRTTFLYKDQRGWQVPNAVFVNDFPVIIRGNLDVQYRIDHGTLCLFISASWWDDKNIKVTDSFGTEFMVINWTPESSEVQIAYYMAIVPYRPDYLLWVDGEEFVFK